VSKTKHETSERFDRGLAVRREVIGDSYVDHALSTADALTWPLQELVTEYCWGSVWTRKQLERRDRSLINLGMLTALNRPHEIETHVRGALNNGLSREEIMEAFLQTAVYCGVPAAIDSVRIAQRVFEECDEETSP
jgi:4-carboxymuconolactone decarboxylase